MNCKEASNLFSELRLGTLSPETQQELEEHLNHCQSCQKEWKIYNLFLADTRIEEDFPIPSQLNAKIKYTIDQAKNKKKVPFYRNKQVLACATACCFLLMAGIWGTSHFEALKNDVHSTRITSQEQETAPQNTKTADTMEIPPEQNIPAYDPQPTPAVQPVTPKTAPTTTDSATQDLLADTENAGIAPASETTLPSGGGGSAADGEPYDASTFSRQLPTDGDQGEYSADLTVSVQFCAELLEHYPNTQLAEQTYLITITKAELEEVLKETTTLEEKSEYIILFTE